LHQFLIPEWLFKGSSILTFPSILEKTLHLTILFIPSFPQTSSKQQKLVNQQSRFALPFACSVILNIQNFKNPIIKMLMVNQTNLSWTLSLKASIIHFAIATCATTNSPKPKSIWCNYKIETTLECEE
jgi:hypothetical protein